MGVRIVRVDRRFRQSGRGRDRRRADQYTNGYPNTDADGDSNAHSILYTYLYRYTDGDGNVNTYYHADQYPDGYANGDLHAVGHPDSI